MSDSPIQEWEEADLPVMRKCACESKTGAGYCLACGDVGEFVEQTACSSWNIFELSGDEYGISSKTLRFSHFKVKELSQFNEQVKEASRQLGQEWLQGERSPGFENAYLLHRLPHVLVQKYGYRMVSFPRVQLPAKDFELFIGDRREREALTPQELEPWEKLLGVDLLEKLETQKDWYA